MPWPYPVPESRGCPMAVSPVRRGADIPQLRTRPGRPWAALCFMRPTGTFSTLQAGIVPFLLKWGWSGRLRKKVPVPSGPRNSLVLGSDPSELNETGSSVSFIHPVADLLIRSAHQFDVFPIRPFQLVEQAMASHLVALAGATQMKADAAGVSNSRSRPGLPGTQERGWLIQPRVSTLPGCRRRRM